MGWFRPQAPPERRPAAAALPPDVDLAVVQLGGAGRPAERGEPRPPGWTGGALQRLEPPQWQLGAVLSRPWRHRSAAPDRGRGDPGLTAEACPHQPRLDWRRRGRGWAWGDGRRSQRREAPLTGTMRPGMAWGSGEHYRINATSCHAPSRGGASACSPSSQNRPSGRGDGAGVFASLEAPSCERWLSTGHSIAAMVD